MIRFGIISVTYSAGKRSFLALFILVKSVLHYFNNLVVILARILRFY